MNTMNTIYREKPMKLAYMEAAIRRLYEEGSDYTQLLNLLKGLQKPIQAMSKLPLNRIKRGVLCSHCSHCSHKINMQYRKLGWQFPKCHAPRQANFLEALNDYRLLVSEQMTNQMFRDFFGIDAPSTARKMLSNLQLAVWI